MASITINGKSIEVADGDEVKVLRDSIKVGGVEVARGLQGIVEIKWSGPLAKLDSAGSVTVSGDVAGSLNAGGSVKCGNVGGNLAAGGPVSCGDVKGNTIAGGSLSCSKK